MKVGYSFTPDDEGLVARATGKELRVKFKDTIEVCAAIQGMKAVEAVKYLEKVLDKKAYIPVKKAKTQSGHKPGMKPFGFQVVKPTKAVLMVLNSALANAEFRGLEPENCYIKSALALRARKMKRVKPKGKHALFATHMTTIQIFLEELSE